MSEEKNKNGNGRLFLIILVAALAGGAYLAEVKNIDFHLAEKIRQNTTLAANPAEENRDQTVPEPAATKPESKLDHLNNAAWMKQSHQSAYNQVRDLPWVRDGLSEREAQAVEELFHIAVSDHSSMKRIIQMPFLASLTETDLLMLRGLTRKGHSGQLSRFLEHPTIRDGITDDETVLATAVTTITDENYIGKLLTPGSATVETIQTSSPRTPNLTISIVRVGDRRTAESSLTVEKAVRHVEDAMGMPLPTNHVIVLLDDTGVIPNFAGVNYGQAIAYLKAGEDGEDWDKIMFERGMVHEVAHHFWRGNNDWIDEGMAQNIEYNYARGIRMPGGITIRPENKCTTKTLRELSRINPGKQDRQFTCNYALGGRFFAELQQHLGEEEFREGAQKLYRLSLEFSRDQKQAGIEEVRKAFGQDNPVIAEHWAGITAGTITESGTEEVPRTPGPSLLEPSLLEPLEEPLAEPLGTISTALTMIFQPPTVKPQTPTVKPMDVIPAPTPIPAPTETPRFHTHTWGKIQMDIPSKWTGEATSKGTLTFGNPEGTAGVEAAVEDWDTTQNTRQDFIQDRLDELLKEAREALRNGIPNPYEKISEGPAGPDLTENLWYAWKLEHLIRRKGQCVQNVVEILAPSNDHTQGIRITAWACQESLSPGIREDRENLLRSFR